MKKWSPPAIVFCSSFTSVIASPVNEVLFPKGGWKTLQIREQYVTIMILNF